MLLVCYQFARQLLLCLYLQVPFGLNIQQELVRSFQHVLIISATHTSYVNPLYRTVPHAHSHVNVPILIDSVTNLRVPLGVRLRDSSSAISACMTSYHSMVRCSLGCLARVQYPGDHSVTQSGKCTRCMEGYQLDGTIRPCHQSRTPRD